jgi:hypothetical protein
VPLLPMGIAFMNCPYSSLHTIVAWLPQRSAGAIRTQAFQRWAAVTDVDALALAIHVPNPSRGYRRVYSRLS